MMFLAGIEFKPVIGFEEYYEVSADGAVFSKITNKFRKQVICPNGYATVILRNLKTGIHKTKTVHRIVAEAWLNRNSNDCVNHKNENKLDNHVNNLEWCTKAYNNTYNGKTQRCCKAIEMYDLDTNKTILTFRGAKEASNKGYANYKNISAVCRGKRKSAGGYGWRFI